MHILALDCSSRSIRSSRDQLALRLAHKYFPRPLPQQSDPGGQP